MTAIVENIFKIRRLINKPVERVYRAWTDEKTLAKWFAPSDDYTVEIDGLNARLGGRYRIILKEKNGTEHPVTGVYEEVEENRLLGLTWSWENDDSFDHNRVTIRFNDADGSTELTLEHGFFPDKKQLEKHEESWNKILDRLQKVV